MKVVFVNIDKKKILNFNDNIKYVFISEKKIFINFNQ